ncbi:MAG TPA: PDZ domain-containing protein, partial [Candidatus Acidoferrales bacterium]|nr:PDZ domain-containing protein [Candidatus Acidoferrales bacterium]
ATIRYSISLSGRANGRFLVRMEVPNVQDSLEVDMPVWNALYQVRDFASRIEQLHAATPSGGPLALRRLTPHSWRVSGASGAVVLDYSILWDEPGPFSSQINDEHAFLNLATVLLFVPARRAEDVSLEFTAVPSGWQSATALDAGPSPGSFVAPGYDALCQAPVEVGTFSDFTLQLADRPVRVVVHAADVPGGPPAAWSRERLEDVASRIVLAETSLMGDAPFPRYLFLLHLGTGGGGGMEHPNSTAIAVGSGEDPAPTMAHEFFHLWNVLRIRPQSLEPVDYTREQPTDTLWFAEGVTSTVASYTMLRSGLWTRDLFYRDLASQIAELSSRPARRFQSVEDSSLAAWLEKYPGYHGRDSSISYYNKGQLLGLCLDILLREATENRESLDTLLRAMNRRYAQQHKFYADTAAIQSLAEELAGRDLSDFFRRYVAGTDDVPFEEIFARGGLKLQTEERTTSDPGFRVRRAGAAGVQVTEVTPGGPADRAGLLRGDTILAVNGHDPSANMRQWLEALAPGDSLRLRVARAAGASDISIVVGSRTLPSPRVSEANVSGLPRAIREGILTGK